MSVGLHTNKVRDLNTGAVHRVLTSNSFQLRLGCMFSLCQSYQWMHIDTQVTCLMCIAEED